MSPALITGTSGLAGSPLPCAHSQFISCPVPPAQQRPGSAGRRPRRPGVGCLPEEHFILKGKMLSPNDKKLEKLDPFYRPSMSKQKTSAEIISEARNALRTVRTQRPFTPREDQRKLFGPASSRTPENRPPSSFSLHASSFESSDSRPISSARLSPLELRPKAPASPAPEEDLCFSFPKPPVDAAKMRRISSARARLFRAASQGALLPDRTLPPAESKKTVESKETIVKGDPMVKTNGIYLTESNAMGHLKSHPLQLTYDGGFSEIQEQEMFKGTTSLPSHLRSGGEQGKRCSRASSYSSSSDVSRLAARAVSKANLQEKDTEIEVDEVFWNTRIVPILHELEKEENIETICAACTQLHHALAEGNMLGNKFKRRSILLKTLYKLVDIGSDLLSLKLAKLILALKVSRRNLLNVCKLIFKISRSEKNDSLIENDSILESLLEVLRNEDLHTNTEAFLYCMGAIKFISGNPGFLDEMISKGAVEILVNLIKQINENTRKCGTCLPNSGHLLVQMTATLRNLVDSPPARSKLLSISALPQLCAVMGQYMADKDVCTNIARIFSKLTSYHDCCAALANCSRCYALFLKVINKYQKKQDLVVRIVFILGNLTAKNHQAREQFSKEKGSIPTLLSLFHTFYKLDLCAEEQMGEAQQPKVQRPRAPAEDVLIKLTRVLANLAIHPGIGPALATNPHAVGLLLATLEYKSIEDCEELVINTTATINNLSYYQVKNSIIQDKKLYIAELLIKLLVSNNMDGILEAVRVFGNLSQDHDICDFIVQKNVHKFMIALLDAKHQDICFSACGVLLNLTVDKSKRVILKEGGGIKKLVDCLRHFGPTDWQLACLVCKTLWNFSENITNASSCFGDEDTNTLLVLLPSFLDEELALDGSFDQDLKNYHKLQWETEFKPVAQQLLNRIQSHHTFLEPLPIPSF
ncbi:armadillo repeat-containing protein 2 isoform X1 [Prionailurus viverrinus]|uniref:armadillo repeat-containing protein 2 isoform X1 n=2 Tax=Prionailurus viverrinus TaxID=61388 RepID=UPI001FF53F8B|nr:armadillo repeat-containing protein 2 isoform X1 [Prionailurus viverrinus]